MTDNPLSSDNTPDAPSAATIDNPVLTRLAVLVGDVDPLVSALAAAQLHMIDAQLGYEPVLSEYEIQLAFLENASLLGLRAAVEARLSSMKERAGFLGNEGAGPLYQTEPVEKSLESPLFSWVEDAAKPGEAERRGQLADEILRQAILGATANRFANRENIYRAVRGQAIWCDPLMGINRVREISEEAAAFARDTNLTWRLELDGERLALGVDEDLLRPLEAWTEQHTPSPPLVLILLGAPDHDGRRPELLRLSARELSTFPGFWALERPGREAAKIRSALELRSVLIELAAGHDDD